MIIDPNDGTKRMPSPKELLEKIRNDRRARSIQSDGNADEIAERADWSAIQQSRLTNEPADRTSHASIGADTTTSDRGQSANGSTVGTRPTVGETGRDSSSTNQHSERLTADTAESSSSNRIDPALLPKSRFRPFAEYQRAIKESFAEKKKDEKVRPKGKVLTEAEIKLNYNKLVEVILWQSEHMDEFIIATTKGHDKTIVIWGDIDRDDACVVVDYLMEEGRTKPQTATIVRAMLALRLKIQLGLITVPRAYRTLQEYLRRGISIL